MAMKAYQIGVKNGKTKIMAATKDPFSWFPELRHMFNNFSVNKMFIDVDPGKLKHFDKIYFKITK